MKRLIIISLFILISSKINDIEFGKDTTFENRKEFHFTAEKNGTLITKILYEGPSKILFDFKSDGSDYSGSFGKPGHVIINELKKGYFYNITFSTDSNDKGTIWLNPSWNELKLDLNKMYEWKFHYHSITGYESRITYTTDNADKDVTFKFTYNKRLTSELPNPFIVCQGEDCKDNIETYDFKQGKSYKVIIKTVKSKDGKKDAYDLPSFKFGDIKGDWSYSFNLKSNLWIISLLFLLII